jgi:outer membrane protein assembly factor BamA
VAQTGPAAPPTVTSVELHLPPGARIPERLRVDIRVGQPFSRRAIRRSISRLYSTGQLEDVVALAFPDEGGVRVVFELTPKQYLSRVAVVGNRALDTATVLQIAGLGPKSEFTDALLRRARERIAEAYRQRGYDEASTSVSLEESGGELSLEVQISEGEPTLIDRVTVAGSPGLPLERILEQCGLSVGGVLDRTKLAEGLERLRATYREERHFRARVGEPLVELTGRRATVSLPISAGPSYRLHFHGNNHVPDRVLRAVLRYDGSEALDPPLMLRLARRLQAYYQARGFVGAQVVPREVISPDRTEAILAFDVTEGPQLEVSELLFEGNERISTDELRRQVQAAVQRRDPLEPGDLGPSDDTLQLEGRTRKLDVLQAPAPPPDRVYSEEAYLEAAEAMTQLYRDRGFLAARVRVEDAAIDFSARTARVRFVVQEGSRTTISGVSVAGLPEGLQVPAGALPRAGDPLSVREVERGREALLQLLGGSGYLFGRVGLDIPPAVGGASAVTYRVEPGPQARINQVTFHGVDRSDREVLRAHLDVKEGDVLDPVRLYEMQRSLSQLGTFKQVNVRVEEPEREEALKDLRVDLLEKPVTEGEVGVGFSALDGLRTLLDWAYPNVNGQALNLEGRLKLHWVGIFPAWNRFWGLAYRDPRCAPTDPDEEVAPGYCRIIGLEGFGGLATVSMRMPRITWLRPVNLGGRIDLVAERAFRSSYEFSRLAAIAGLDWPATPWLTAAIQYEWEHDRVARIGDVARLLPTGVDDRLLFDFGLFTLHSLRPSLSMDFRDDPANPQKGLALSASGELTSGLRRDFPLYTIKLQGNVTGYVPLWPRVILAASLRAGRVLLLEDTPRTVPTKRFFLGGFTSMRGFREDGVIPADVRADLRKERDACRALLTEFACTDAAKAILGGEQIPSGGGELFTLGKLELRFPFYGSFDMGLFVETGNLWLRQERYDPWELRWVAGGGIRYQTPIGPVALDLGVNLFPDLEVNEQTFNFHFNIGLF